MCYIFSLFQVCSIQPLETIGNTPLQSILATLWTCAICYRFVSIMFTRGQHRTPSC